MSLSQKYQTLFIHIPKTGGSFITNNILNMGRRKHQEHGKGKSNLFGIRQNIEYTHLTGSEIKKILGDSFDDYYKFSFVRNPFDRLVSEFFYLKKTPAANKGFLTSNSFNTFIQNLYKKFPDLYTFKQIKINHYIPQTKFLYDENGEVMVDFVGRFENFKEDIQVVMEKINKTVPIKRTNTTKHKPYKHYYNPTTQKMVEEMYEEDLNYFNYIF